MRWSDWLYAVAGRQSGIALPRLAELLFEFLTKELRLTPAAVAGALWHDYRRGGRTDKPKFLRDYVKDDSAFRSLRSVGLKRQSRHLAHGTERRSG